MMICLLTECVMFSSQPAHVLLMVTGHHGRSRGTRWRACAACWAGSASAATTTCSPSPSCRVRCPHAAALTALVPTHASHPALTYLPVSTHRSFCTVIA